MNVEINKTSKMKELEISRGRQKKSMPPSYYDGETESIRDRIKFISHMFQILVHSITHGNNCNMDWQQYIHIIAVKFFR